MEGAEAVKSEEQEQEKNASADEDDDDEEGYAGHGAFDFAKMMLEEIAMTQKQSEVLATNDAIVDEAPAAEEGGEEATTATVTSTPTKKAGTTHLNESAFFPNLDGDALNEDAFLPNFDGDEEQQREHSCDEEEEEASCGHCDDSDYGQTQNEFENIVFFEASQSPYEKTPSKNVARSPFTPLSANK